MKSQRLAAVHGHLVSNAVASAKQQPLHYTLDGFNILSEADRQFFEENGYFVVKKLISDEQLQKYKKRFVEICDKQVVYDDITVMKDVALAKSKANFVQNERTVTKIQSFQSDPILMEYCENRKILQYAEAFVGKDIMAMHTMLINKPPDPGTKSSRHPLHQDLHYFPFRPADKIVASWTAMQRVTRENGCLVVLPGTHKGKLLRHDYPEWEGGVNSMYHGVKDFDINSPRVHLEMDPGDTVFFHPILIHGSGTNVSQNFRKAISCHFASSHCNYIDVNGTVQENIANEGKAIYKKKHGDEVPYELADLWYMKGRVVQGDRITL